MERSHIMLLIMGVAVLNGLYSPIVLVFYSLAPGWVPQLIDYSPQLLFWGSSFLTVTLVLLVSGVPAALAERFFRREVTVESALWIWFVGALVCSLPAVLATY